MKKIPVDFVRHLFTYEDGRLIWKNCSKPWRNGSSAGFLCDKKILNYKIMQVRIPTFGDYKCSRIIWAVCYGKDPFPFEIDHIDGNSLNDNIENLRLAKREENCRNRKVSVTNLVQAKGISIRKNGTYLVRITKNYRTIHLGYFKTKEMAIKAYKKACDKLHGEFACY